MGRAHEVDRRKWNLGTWNIRSLYNKEEEIIKELVGFRLEILALSETKKKGRGKIIMNGDHVLIYLSLIHI